jgi:hypothetical protein
MATERACCGYLLKAFIKGMNAGGLPVLSSSSTTPSTRFPFSRRYSNA